MRYLLIFFIIKVYLFGDISNIILKIKNIENIKKNFLTIDYNIFSNNSLNSSLVNIGNLKNNKLNINLKIFAIFNNKVNINGKWYKIGEYINNYKIIKITDNGIYLMKNSKLFYIKIINNNILKVK